MTGQQTTFIALTFLGPPLLWLLSRKVQSPRFARGISLAMVASLFLALLAALILKWRSEGLSYERTLPMQLCDWAAFALMLALVRRGRTAFELAYFWGLSGTVQALFTPAVDLIGFEGFIFLYIHAIIPAGVLWLIFEYKMRPHSLWRAMAWSQLYIAAALLVNWLANANYGFLHRKPDNPSLLDKLADPGPLYILQMDLLALVFFTALYLPWWIARHMAHAMHKDPA